MCPGQHLLSPSINFLRKSYWTWFISWQFWMYLLHHSAKIWSFLMSQSFGAHGIIWTYQRTLCMASMVHEPVNFVVDESMHHRPKRCIKLSNCNAPSVQQISWSQMGGWAFLPHSVHRTSFCSILWISFACGTVWRDTGDVDVNAIFIIYTILV